MGDHLGRKLVSLFFLSFLLVGSWLSLVPLVKADSTFGNTNIEASNTSVGYVRAYSFSLGEDGTVTVIDAYCNYASAGNSRVAIYSDVASHPSALLVESNSEAIVATDWHTFDVADTFLSAGTYWLAFQNDGGVYNRMGVDAGRGYEYDSHVYGAFPDPIVPIEEDGKVGSIYATYTVGGQDLTFPLFENFNVLSSVSKGVELHNPLFQNFNTWSSLTTNREAGYSMFEPFTLWSSRATSKEQSFNLFEPFNLWSSLTHATEGVAHDLTFTLFEVVSPIPYLSMVYGEATTLSDVESLAGLALILAVVAIALIIAYSKK